MLVAESVSLFENIYIYIHFILSCDDAVRFNAPLSVDLELNDVRAPRSEKLKFWFELALRWTTDKSKIKNQVSMNAFSQPGKFDPKQQLTYVITYPGNSFPRCLT